MLYSASLGLANRVNTRLPPTNKFSERNHERDFVSVFVQAGERYAVPRDVSLTVATYRASPDSMEQ